MLDSVKITELVSYGSASLLIGLFTQIVLELVFYAIAKLFHLVKLAL